MASHFALGFWSIVLCWFWGMSEYELELVVFLMPFGLFFKMHDIFCFDTEQCIVEFSTGKIDCYQGENGTKPPKSKQSI